MIQALIFDFDGLLVDTETPAFESWQRIYAEYGQSLSLDLWQGALGTMHGFDALQHLASLVHLDDPEGVMARRQALKQELSRNQPLLPGVLEILDEAQRLGLPCAVASSSSRAWVEGWLKHHKIYERFQSVLTADDVVRTKPFPDLFLLAAERLNSSPTECLIFEDSSNGILAARAAGIRVVAVPGAITSQLKLPEADLRIESLAAMPLSDILGYFNTNH
mgnify:CR=1 FL=1|jgi:haloacid dehalogenase superfamily, subfamily IA, variant 3 with third motif having DD or ED